MPTVPGVKSESLNPKQTLEKVTGLITELGLDEDTPETVPAPETPSEPPPESSDTEAPETTDERYEVKVDGEPVVVDLEELKNGYSRDADYRKKTMALADERRAFETESQAVAQERQQYQAGLAQLRSALERIQGEPDWEQLRNQMEPAEFLDTLAGLIDQDYVVSNKVGLRTIEDVERAAFSVNSAYAKDLRDALNPSRKREQERTKRERRR